MADVVVTRRLPEAALARLREAAADVWISPHERPLDARELRDAVPGARALVTLLYDRVDAALLDAAGPQLQVVANVAVGYDNVDVEACRARGVVVTNTPGVLTDATADLALALLLAVTRRLGEGERLIRSGRPWRWDVDLLLGEDLRERRLGVVGLGAIGTAFAHRARALGLRVAYAQRHRADAEVEAALGGAEHLPLGELLAGSDVVSLHCPLTAQTRHLLDADALAAMPDHAVLINTARGPLVDEEALVDALRGGALAGAGLDVYEDEPRVHPGLLERDDVVLLPHLGSATRRTRERMALLAADNVAACLRGDPPVTEVN